MKNLILLLLAVVLLSPNLALSQVEVPLKHFLVYTKSGIEARSGDFEGRTGSGGDILFSNWHIKQFDSYSNIELKKELNSFSVFAGGNFTIDSGSMTHEKSGQWYYSSVDACKISVRDNRAGHPSAYLPRSYQRPFCQQKSTSLVSHSNLSEQIDRLSNELSSKVHQNRAKYLRSRYFKGSRSIIFQGRGYGTNYFAISSSELNRVENLWFLGNHSESFVVQIEGRQQINIKNVGFYLRTPDGEINHKYAPHPGQIYFNFPKTSEIVIERSGANSSELGYSVGVPITFIAPNAKLVVREALITGAIYADSYLGVLNNQVNKVCLSGLKTLEADCRCIDHRPN